MKKLLFLTFLMLIGGCGKDSSDKKTKTRYVEHSLSPLKAKGITFMHYSGPNGPRVFITCSETSSTNAEKLAELRSFKKSLDLDSPQSKGFTIDTQKLTPEETGFLLNDAIEQLQYYYPNSTYCPAEILSSIY